ncbi:MAG: ImmA/IrrE family metallo-endopeptidase [Dehalococcoidia bacterium]
MQWSEAHRVAMLAAAHAHRDLGIDTSRRIDVFAAIEKSDILLAFEPFPRLSGAYFSDPNVKAAILINANHPLSRQRYTAAHELGHHLLSHGTSVDPATEPLFRWGGTNPPDTEMVAEAFAAWFLMPPRLVQSCLSELGIVRPERPDEVYTLSLRLGTSYEATARHLPNLQLASGSAVDGWIRVQPRDIKTALTLGMPVGDLRYDLWPLTYRDNDRHFVVQPGDRLVVSLSEIPSSGFTWQYDEPPLGCVFVADSFERQSTVDMWNRAAPENLLGEAEGAEVRRAFEFEVSLEAPEVSSTLSFRKEQPWDPDAVSDRYAISLRIEPPRRGVPQDKLVLQVA